MGGALGTMTGVALSPCVGLFTMIFLRKSEVLNKYKYYILIFSLAILLYIDNNKKAQQLDEDTSEYYYISWLVTMVATMALVLVLFVHGKINQLK